MKLCTTTVITGLDQKAHFAIVPVGEPGWPIAVFGCATGAGAKKAKDEAEFFAAAPAMLDMLELLAKEFGAINPAFPLSAGKAVVLDALAERASKLVAKHAALRL